MSYRSILSDKGIIREPFICDGITLSLSISSLLLYLGLPKGSLDYNQLEKDIRDFFPCFIKMDYNHYNKIIRTLNELVPSLTNYKVKSAEIDISTHYLDIVLIKID